MVVRGIDNLNYHTPRALQNLWKSHKEELSIPDGITTTIYHFGFSEETRLIHTYMYASIRNFESEPISYGIGAKPQCQIPEPLHVPDDFRIMMDEQRTIQAKCSKEQRIYIGGEIQLHVLSDDGISIQTISRFDDLEQIEKEIYENYNQNRKDADHGRL
jgi:hypothetical protein